VTTPNTQDFAKALRTLRSTGEIQKIGTFTFSQHRAGFASVQQIERIDWLTKLSAGMSPRIGGMKFWPHSETTFERVAEQYARDEATEIARRANVATIAKVEG